MSGRRAQHVEQIGIGVFVRPILISVAMGTAVCIAVLLLLSVLLSVKSIPQSLISPMATFAVTLGALIAGFCSAKLIRKNGLAYGAVCGAALSLIVLMAGISLPGNDLGMTALFKVAFIMLAAMLGGVLGINTRARRRR